jgi:hypothetical protein
VDLGFEHESFGVYQQMSLTALDLLASYSITAFLSAHACALERLGIHYAGAELRISLQSDPQAFPNCCIDPFPGAVDTLLSEVVVDGGPSRKLVRKHTPLAAAP